MHFIYVIYALQALYCEGSQPKNAIYFSCWVSPPHLGLAYKPHPSIHPSHSLTHPPTHSLTHPAYMHTAHTLSPTIVPILCKHSLACTGSPAWYFSEDFLFLVLLNHLRPNTGGAVRKKQLLNLKFSQHHSQISLREVGGIRSRTLASKGYIIRECEMPKKERKTVVDPVHFLAHHH